MYYFITQETEAERSEITYQCHTAGKSWSLGLNPPNPAPEPALLTPVIQLSFWWQVRYLICQDHG